MNILAIDPGKEGAIAFLGSSGECLVLDMPTYEVKDGKSTKRHIDRKQVMHILKGVDAGEYTAFIETQQAYPNQGSVSNWSTGFGYGLLLMALDALGIPYETVHPKTWQKHFGIKGGTKGQACAIAERLFPEISIRGPRGRAMDGRADALLIGEWGRRRIGKD